MPSSIAKSMQFGEDNALIYGISDDDYYFKNCLVAHTEPEFQEIINLLIPSDGICIDIGANIGIKTFVMAKQAKDGIVLSIEGAPNVYEVLKLNITNNKLYNVRAVNAAVTDTTTTVRFIEDSAFGHLATGDDASAGTDVPGMTLGDLMEAHLPAGGVSFVKIDTEGYEFTILKDAVPVLRQNNPWIYFEFNSFCLCAYGDSNPKDFLEYIFENFKYVFRIEKNSVNIGSALLRRYERSDMVFLVHENIVSNGSVDDFLVTNRDSALTDVHYLLNPNPFAAQYQQIVNQYQQLAAQCQQIADQCQQMTEQHQEAITEHQTAIERYQQAQATMQAELYAMQHSRSWRLTAPLRRLAGMLRSVSR